MLAGCDARGAWRATGPPRSSLAARVVELYGVRLHHRHNIICICTSYGIWPCSLLRPIHMRPMCAHTNVTAESCSWGMVRAARVWSWAIAVFSCVFGVGISSRAFFTFFHCLVLGRFVACRAPRARKHHYK